MREYVNAETIRHYGNAYFTPRGALVGEIAVRTVGTDSEYHARFRANGDYWGNVFRTEWEARQALCAWWNACRNPAVDRKASPDNQRQKGGA